MNQIYDYLYDELIDDKIFIKLQRVLHFIIKDTHRVDLINYIAKRAQ